MTSDGANVSGSHVDSEELSESVRWLFVVLGVASWTNGVFGNIYVLTALTTRAALRSPHNIFIGHLAVADLYVVGYGQVFWVWDVATGSHLTANDTHCAINGYVGFSSCVAGILFLWTISCNRYISICHHATYRKLRITKWRASWICGAVWVASFAFSSIPFYGPSEYGYEEKSRSCFLIRSRSDNLTNIAISVLITIILLSLAYFNLAIFRFWRQSKRRVSQWKTAGPKAASNDTPRNTDDRSKGRPHTNNQSSSRTFDENAAQTSNKSDIRLDNADDIAADSYGVREVLEIVTTNEVPERVTTHEFPEIVTTNEVSEIVTTLEVSEIVTTNEVSEIVTTLEVSEIVTSNEVSEIVTTLEVSEIVTTNEVPERVTINEVPERVTTNEVPEIVTTYDVRENRQIVEEASLVEGASFSGSLAESDTPVLNALQASHLLQISVERTSPPRLMTAQNISAFDDKSVIMMPADGTSSSGLLTEIPTQETTRDTSKSRLAPQDTDLYDNTSTSANIYTHSSQLRVPPTRRKTTPVSMTASQSSTTAETSQSGHRSSASDRGLVLSLLAVYVCVIVTYGMSVGITAVIARVELPQPVVLLASLMLFANSSVNWIIYAAFNKNFRLHCTCWNKTCCGKLRARGVGLTR